MNPPPTTQTTSEAPPKARIAWSSVFAYGLILALGLLALVPLLAALR